MRTSGQWERVSNPKKAILFCKTQEARRILGGRPSHSHKNADAICISIQQLLFNLKVEMNKTKHTAQHIPQLALICFHIIMTRALFLISEIMSWARKLIFFLFDHLSSPFPPFPFHEPSPHPLWSDKNIPPPLPHFRMQVGEWVEPENNSGEKNSERGKIKRRSVWLGTGRCLQLLLRTRVF